MPRQFLSLCLIILFWKLDYLIKFLMEIYFWGVFYTFDKLKNYTSKFVTIPFVQIVFCVILMLQSTIYVFVLSNHLVRHFCVLFNAMQPKLNSNMCWEGGKIQFSHVMIWKCKYIYEKILVWNCHPKGQLMEPKVVPLNQPWCIIYNHFNIHSMDIKRHMLICLFI
jgi:hypothetical protein